MSNAELAKITLSTILGLLFVNVGIAHFTETKWFEPIVPEALGDPTFWVLITGFIEIGLGLGSGNSANSQIFCPINGNIPRCSILG
ncbi:MAG: hypothetical protein CM15mP47_2400 [Methanobacteriota archaeon]|nr:MAG: hypothetical protein CM15mP47_2400 [Euryarchaeota archaeon]